MLLVRLMTCFPVLTQRAKQHGEREKVNATGNVRVITKTASVQCCGKTEQILLDFRIQGHTQPGRLRTKANSGQQEAIGNKIKANQLFSLTNNFFL